MTLPGAQPLRFDSSAVDCRDTKATVRMKKGYAERGGES